MSVKRNAEYERIHQRRYRRRRLANGGERLTVDVDELRPYLTRWLSEGYSFRAIAQFTGLSHYTLVRISTGENKRATMGTADLIRQAKPDINLLAPQMLVDATGTRRRLQALACAGWTATELDRRRGVVDTGDVTWRLYRRVRVSKRIHDEIRDLANRLWLLEPPRRTAYQRREVAKAIRRAMRNGWAPLAAWDDIDDPEEKPKGLLQRSEAA